MLFDFFEDLPTYLLTYLPTFPVLYASLLRRSIKIAPSCSWYNDISNICIQICHIQTDITITHEQRSSGSWKFQWNDGNFCQIAQKISISSKRRHLLYFEVNSVISKGNVCQCMCQKKPQNLRKETQSYKITLAFCFVLKTF